MCQRFAHLSGLRCLERLDSTGEEDEDYQGVENEEEECEREEEEEDDIDDFKWMMRENVKEDVKVRGEI